jgi:acetolactate synthase-1/2/3 large subunit
VPEDHPLALGRTWSPSGPGAQILDEADLVLAIGAPMAGGQGSAAWDPRMVAGARSPERLAREVILIDWDDQDHRALPARARLYGHVPTIVTALAGAVAPRGDAVGFPAERLDAIRQWPWEYADRRVPWAEGFFRGLREAMPRDGVLLLDSLVGLWLDRLFPAYEARTVRFPFGTGTLGFGAPAAVGAKLARPEREVVVVAGDGAFLYNPQELATMMRYGQKLTIVVANDNCYGAIKHNMEENFGRATAHELANPDFVRLAEAFGMRGVRLDTPDAVGPALAEALAGDRSTLIEAPLELRPPRQFYT